MTPEEMLESKQADDLQRAALKIEPEPEIVESYDYDDAADAPKYPVLNEIDWIFDKIEAQK